MKEDFLHYVWRYKKFNLQNLYTTTGASISILSFGIWNLDAGPDFLEASIKIGNKIWSGHVEIHVHASEWQTHKHHLDRKYDQTILHVVFEEDKVIFTNGSRLPCLELKGLIKPKTLRQYFTLRAAFDFIPCENMVRTVPSDQKLKWIEKLGIEKLKLKAEHLSVALELVDGDWETLFFQQTAKYMGASKNKDQMLLFACQIPLQIIRRHRDQELFLESFFFGQAGMLMRNFMDEYPNFLKNEYKFIRQKYELQAVNPQIWNFFRLRPANFPTIRIAQLAALYADFPNPFQELSDSSSIREIEAKLSSVAHEYWDSHYIFDKESAFRIKSIGRERMHLIIINVLLPMMYLFAVKNQEKGMFTKSFELLSSISKERNNLILAYEKLGFQANSALQTQGLLHLYNDYCADKKCSHCSLGNTILNLH